MTVGVTISSFLGETTFSGPVAEAAAELAGRRVTVLEGRLASAAGTGSAALYVSDGARPLPLEWKLVQTDGTTTTTFGAWGHAVPVAAPPGAVGLPATPGATITVGVTRPA